MARTRKNKPGGARRQKDTAARAKQQPATGGRPDGERPAKRQRVERAAGRTPSRPSNTARDACDAEQEAGEQGDEMARLKRGLDPADVVPTTPKPKHKPTRPAKPSPVSLAPRPATLTEQLEQPSPKTNFASLLARTHHVISLSIISSSPIQKKVSRVLSHISSPDIKKPPLVILTAKAGVASKAITIAEISKREIGNGGGTWFQYSGVEGVLGEWAPKDRGTKVEGEKAGTKDGGAEDEGAIESGVLASNEAEASKEEADGDEEEEEEEAFENMRDPPATNPTVQEYPSVIEHELRKKIRAIPVLTIYLSRARVGELKKEYGYVT
jgi:Alba